MSELIINHAGTSRDDQVSIAGSFTNWSPQSMSFNELSETFEYKIKNSLRDKLYFKFIVNGSWITSSDYSSVFDNSGNQNNVIDPKNMTDWKESTEIKKQVNPSRPAASFLEMEQNTIPLEASTRAIEETYRDPNIMVIDKRVYQAQQRAERALKIIENNSKVNGKDSASLLEPDTHKNSYGSIISSPLNEGTSGLEIIEVDSVVNDGTVRGASSPGYTQATTDLQLKQIPSTDQISGAQSNPEELTNEETLLLSTQNFEPLDIISPVCTKNSHPINKLNAEGLQGKDSFSFSEFDRFSALQDRQFQSLSGVPKSAGNQSQQDEGDNGLPNETNQADYTVESFIVGFLAAIIQFFRTIFG
ncbi:hypothetical protein WICPIJ_004860 [Wickerhamomyces pijperi]|uniref:AMP-activated protein kinase glycogen-binding domain-containing protein n=1 Tax=Wickerhamomyces pijperi TaxID=599730 RepID=A0A9P8TMD0_WICPI|nr:hypothetical protein WICPIJ_004860 [Wickerhamomyces pijperi]